MTRMERLDLAPTREAMRPRKCRRFRLHPTPKACEENPMKTQRTPAERRVRATAADVLRVARMSRPISEPAWQVFARAAEIAAGATVGLVNDDMVDSARDMARAWVLLTKLAATTRERATDRALASLRTVA